MNTYQIYKAMYLCVCFCSISLICLSFANTKCFIDFCKFIIRFLNYLYVLRRRQWHPPLQYSCLENPMDGGAW